MLEKRASKLCHKRRRTDTKLENPLVWIHSRTAFYLPFDLREGEKHFFHEQKMAKLSGVAQGSGPSPFASNSSTEREDGEFVTGNALDNGDLRQGWVTRFHSPCRLSITDCHKAVRIVSSWRSSRSIYPRTIRSNSSLLITLRASSMWQMRSESSFRL